MIAESDGKGRTTQAVAIFPVPCGLPAPDRPDCPLTQTAMSPRARILFVALMLGVAAVCIRLGFWQRSRLIARRAANATAEAARRLPELDLAVAGADALGDRHVVARGTYDETHDMLLRGQVLSGSPGVVVVTPLRGARGDSAVLVVRGFIPSPDGISVPQLDSLGEPGLQTVSGIARTLPLRTGRGQPLARDGRMTWKELELEPVRGELPYPVMGILLFAAPGAGPAWPRRLEPPPLDDGPHFSYMLQWFGFAATAVVMALIALVRRRAAEWSEPTAAVTSAGAPPPARWP